MYVITFARSEREKIDTEQHPTFPSLSHTHSKSLCKKKVHEGCSTIKRAYIRHKSKSDVEEPYFSITYLMC